MKFADALNDARGVEIENIAVEHEGEGPFGNSIAEGVEHSADFGVGEARALAITHPFAGARFDFAEMNIGNDDGMSHRTEADMLGILRLSGNCP